MGLSNLKKCLIRSFNLFLLHRNTNERYLREVVLHDFNVFDVGVTYNIEPGIVKND